MADNTPSFPPKIRPPLPSSGRTGLPKSPTTKLPPVQKSTTTGKVVVMLSSVAKAAPSGTQQLTRTAAPVVAPPKVLPAVENAPAGGLPPPLPSSASTPAKPVAAVPAQLPAQPRLSSTTHVKLPPKTAVPSLVSLTGKPGVGKPGEKVAPPLLPSKGSALISTAVDKKAPISAPPLGGAALPGKSELKKTGSIVLNPAPVSGGKTETKRPGVIKLKSPAAEDLTPGESIFPPTVEAAAPAAAPSLPANPPPLTKAPLPNPEGWKRLQPGELPTLPGTTDPFAHSQRLEPKPEPVAPVGLTKAPAPASSTHGTEAKAGPSMNPAPVALPSAKTAEPPAKPQETSAILHVAPPMTEKARDHDEHREKLPPPHFPEPAKVPALSPVAKAPALVVAEPGAAKPLPPPLPAGSPASGKPAASAPAAAEAKLKAIPPSALDLKPALKPAVLPKRSMPLVVDPPTDPAPSALKVGPIIPENQPPSVAPGSSSATMKAGSAVERLDDPLLAKKGAKPEETAALPGEAKKPTRAISGTTSARIDAALRGATSPTVPGTESRAEKMPAEKSVLPVAVAAGAGAATALKPADQPSSARLVTRTERVKARRLRAALFFWLLLMPAAATGLFVGMLYFGRHTRVEGQVIPPRGMSVSDEVWIVSNFSELANGVADDLAKDRVPLQREIQERRDHVQRAQADVASREERIRLIQAEIQATRDEINGVIKKSRDDTQKLWDGEGAQIDAEYQSHLDSLQHTIAQRALSLKLSYQPDPAYPSPEVWANAYRLALYQVPAGVDGIKEHQWVGDQLKQWRDFLKTLDERKEQLREKAAQLKLEPAPKIADLNSKIDDLNQRIQGTQAEEEPIKIELQQAQTELTQAEAADAGLDEKYYKQLDALPAESVSFKIPLKPNGRFTWEPDNNPFSEGEVLHKYLIFSRAIRADGREYWALHRFALAKDKTVELTIEPTGYMSTKAVLRPNLSPDEQEQ